tara:strand:- start:102 stop:260 length:159 start_codon:yes stop_codon:yes gene_type:complete
MAGSLALHVLLGARASLSAGAGFHVCPSGSLALHVLLGAGTGLSAGSSNLSA